MSTVFSSRATGLKAKLALLAVAGGFVGATGASAAGIAAADDDVPRIAIRFDAAVLATDAGVQQLYRRLVSAARIVCPAEPTRSMGVGSELQQCRDQAVARAIAQIRNPRLAALHASNLKAG